MTVKQVREIIADYPDDTEIIIGSWFADGPRHWVTKAPLNQDGFFKRTKKLMLFYFDDCLAHRVEID